jgi:alpha-beta hydrolase superfamily lysophospholipase
MDLPALGLHGTDDPVSPYADARTAYASVAGAQLVGVVGGRHDVLNDASHRTVAATIVLFLERLRLGVLERRLGASLPEITRAEPLRP